NTLHNAIMEAGSKDRPPMLAPGNYIQWKSKIKRYIDTKPNQELIYYCLENPPYELGWKEKAVLDSEGNRTTATERHDLCVPKSVAKPLRKTVASESNKKPRNNVRKLHERFGKIYKWSYIKFTPSGYMWKPKLPKGNVNPNVSMPLGNASRTANVKDTMTSRHSIVSNTSLKSTCFIRDLKGTDLFTVKKMEDEFYNLMVKGNDLKTCVRKFQELAVLCPNMVPNTEKLMEVFIGGLPQSIKGTVTASKP
nr:reverse transcriptase domain-containing protein [Tanacetum cinerariifolium]